MSNRRYCVRCTDGRDYIVKETYSELNMKVVYGSDEDRLKTYDGMTILARHVVAFWEEEL